VMWVSLRHAARTANTSKRVVAKSRRASDAYSGIEEYFQKMVDVEVEESKVPKFIPGRSGERAMHLWERLYSAGGDQALLRGEKEIDNFVWSVRGNKVWEFLVKTPDDLISRDKRFAVVEEHLQAIGCSPLFIRLMGDLFRSDEMDSLEQIRSDFFLINREHRKEVDVEFITPSMVDAETLAYYKASIALNYLKEEENMIFTHRVTSDFKKGHKIVVKGVTHDFSRDAGRDSYFASLEIERRKRSSDPGFESYLKSIFSLPQLSAEDEKELAASSLGKGVTWVPRFGKAATE